MREPMSTVTPTIDASMTDIAFCVSLLNHSAHGDRAGSLADHVRRQPLSKGGDSRINPAAGQTSVTSGALVSVANECHPADVHGHAALLALRTLSASVSCFLWSTRSAHFSSSQILPLARSHDLQ
jgi:hypothetical protein